VSRGRLVVVSGPSGVGKGTLVAGLRARRPELALSVSATTRPRRAGEVDGVAYRFLDRAEFDRLIDGDGFLEWAEFAGHRYGTPAEPVERLIAAGTDVVLEIEVQGARQVRDRFPDAVLVLLVPPSLDALAQRLRDRGTEDDASLARRLAIAETELASADVFDHVVLNDRLDEAIAAVDRILGATGTPRP